METNKNKIMARDQFREAVWKMAEVIKDRIVPERIKEFQNREIINESLKKRIGGYNPQNPQMSSYPISICKRVFLYQP